MTEEIVNGWIRTEIKKLEADILKCENWVEESKADVKQAKHMLAGFEYKLEQAKTLRSYLKELEAREKWSKIN